MRRSGEATVRRAYDAFEAACEPCPSAGSANPSNGWCKCPIKGHGARRPCHAPVSAFRKFVKQHDADAFRAINVGEREQGGGSTQKFERALRLVGVPVCEAHRVWAANKQVCIAVSIPGMTFPDANDADPQRADS